MEVLEGMFADLDDRIILIPRYSQQRLGTVLDPRSVWGYLVQRLVEWAHWFLCLQFSLYLGSQIKSPF